MEASALKENSLRDAWELYLSFENCQKTKDINLMDFINEWQERMCTALSVGCQYTDQVLAFKLLEKANLTYGQTLSILISLSKNEEGSGEKLEVKTLLSQTLQKLKKLNGMLEKCERRAQSSFEVSTSGDSYGDLDIFLEHGNVECKIESSDPENVKGQSDEMYIGGSVEKLAGNEDNIGCEDTTVHEDELLVNHYLGVNSSDDQVDNLIKNSLNNLPLCPKCNGLLAPKVDSESGESNKEGKYMCVSCEINIFVPDLLLNKELATTEEIDQGKMSRKKECTPKVTRTRSRTSASKTCVLCKKRFQSIEAFQNHQQIAHSASSDVLLRKEGDFQCDQNAIELAKRTCQPVDKATKPVTVVQEPSFLCTYCPKVFAKQNQLKAHLRSHTGEKTHICTVCGKGFSHSSSWIEHCRIHTGEKPFYCHDCGKSFAHRKTYKVHRRLHTGERPYNCDHCGRTFTKSHNFYVHMRGHTGERPYPCSVCGKAFRESNGLKRHMRIHVRDKQQRPGEADKPQIVCDL